MDRLARNREIRQRYRELLEAGMNSEQARLELSEGHALSTRQIDTILYGRR